MTGATQPLNLKRFIIVRMMHLTIGITALFACFFYQFPTLKVLIGVAATVVFFTLLLSQRFENSIYTHVPGMTLGTVAVAWPDKSLITFRAYNFFEHELLYHHIVLM